MKAKVCIKNVIEVEYPDSWSDEKLKNRIRTQANEVADIFVAPDSCGIAHSSMNVNIVAKMDWVRV